MFIPYRPVRQYRYTSGRQLREVLKVWYRCMEGQGVHGIASRVLLRLSVPQVSKENIIGTYTAMPDFSNVYLIGILFDYLAKQEPSCLSPKCSQTSSRLVKPHMGLATYSNQSIPALHRAILSIWKVYVCTNNPAGNISYRTLVAIPYLIFSCKI